MFVNGALLSRAWVYNDNLILIYFTRVLTSLCYSYGKCVELCASSNCFTSDTSFRGGAS